MLRASSFALVLLIAVIAVLPNTNAVAGELDRNKDFKVEPVLQSRSGQCRALLIGVNDYERLNDLRFCEEDVKSLRDRLVEIGFRRDAVKCLTTGDRDPSCRPNYRNITERLDAMFAGLDEDSVLVIALSGHGGSFEFREQSGKDQKESFYCPQDARIHNPQGTMISVKSIYDRLEKCPARFKMLLVDACRNPHMAPAGSRTAIDEAKSIAGFAKSLSDPNSLPKGTLAMISCTSGEQSYEDPRLGHGIFMHFVLEGLAGHADTARLGDRDGMVSYRELKDYVYRNTSEYVWSKFDQAQTPNFHAKWEQPNFDITKVLRRNPPKDFTNSIGMKFKLIPAGEFMMGSPEDEEKRTIDEKQHRVRITKPFYLGVYEVTQEQFERIMGNNPSDHEGSTNPVEQVIWAEAAEFCKKLSAREGRTYRLPTEAQWEYACRAGTTTPFNFGSVLNGKRANCVGIYPYGTETKGPWPTHPTSVGSYAANAWGLYDMHGNVSEWCSDWYDIDYYAEAPTDDPTGPTDPMPNPYHVIRGGSWLTYPEDCRSAKRLIVPDDRFHFLGFRVVLVPPER